MSPSRRPLPEDLTALKKILSGIPADEQTMKRLVNCNLVEEFDSTALLTEGGIRAAARLDRWTAANPGP
jgi:hypothetical protein